ncbi:T9SS type A sorting domain-containing protein [Croceimicrobium hydrocarbonivorans]|uniref:T9SS type A sorting domain-containing protein n=1 Tax=Croceimicrobium hydrocarbonivorans TaxID=2761580 RepID=A0A7H0VF38_9FLAO|nr:T9SS type A sorting domain-containing protein [Croceimicrobium hydrocarbonivorans]QNR24336.1 T9SS type A sorting domain-containing protein [Croceimicrobium hydrocarbonivorans]
MKGCFLFIYIFLIGFSAQAQWTITASDTYTGSQNSAVFTVHNSGDTLLQVGTVITVRPSGVFYPVLSEYEISSGSKIDSVPLQGSGAASVPVGCSWTNDGYYAVSRDSTSQFIGYQNALSKHLEFRRSFDHQGLWSTSGSFLVPNFYGKDIFVNSLGAFWLYNPIRNELNALATLNGDTIMTLDSADMAFKMGVDSTYELLSVYLEGPHWRKSDTSVVYLDFGRRDSFGTFIEFQSKYALFLIDSLKPISSFRDWGIEPNIDYEDFTLIESKVHFNSNNTLDRTIYKRDLLTGNIVDSLKVDSLTYNPDTLQYNPDHYNRFYSRGRFSVYEEEYDYVDTVSGSRTEGFVMLVQKIRLYEDDQMIYERVITDSAKSGFLDTRFLDLIPLPDGGVILNLRVNFDGKRGRIVYIDPQGNHYLHSESVIQPVVDIYPTMVEHKLNVACRSQKYQVLIYGLDGKEVGEYNIETKTDSYQIDLPQLNSGVYYVLISFGENRALRKIVKR